VRHDRFLHHFADGRLQARLPRWAEEPMSLKRESREFRSISELARNRAVAVIRCVDVLLPDADECRKKRIARQILSLCDGRDRSVKITEAQLEDLVLPNLQCIAKTCPLLCFWEPLSRTLNEFFHGEE
jgi:hypothetical protein